MTRRSLRIGCHIRAAVRVERPTEPTRSVLEGGSHVGEQEDRRCRRDRLRRPPRRGRAHRVRARGRPDVPDRRRCSGDEGRRRPRTSSRWRGCSSPDVAAACASRRSATRSTASRTSPAFSYPAGARCSAGPGSRSGWRPLHYVKRSKPCACGHRVPLKHQAWSPCLCRPGGARDEGLLRCTWRPLRRRVTHDPVSACHEPAHVLGTSYGSSRRPCPCSCSDPASREARSKISAAASWNPDGSPAAANVAAISCISPTQRQPLAAADSAAP